MYVRRFSMFVVSAALIAAGACAPLPYEDVVNPDLLKGSSADAEVGLVWMFPGLLGTPGELNDAYRAFRDAGLRKEVRLFSWPTPWTDLFGHLENYAANRETAAQIAADIAAYRQRYPEQPIHLVGYSAGAALAVMIAEALPDDVALDNVVLAHPALSPTYDLTAALAHVDGALICFHSPYDDILGGWFMETFGTLDRQYEPAASMLGFVLDEAVPDPALRDRVIQISWTPAMEQVGHSGMHMPILQYQWNRYVVAPFVVAPEHLRVGRWSVEEFVDQVVLELLDFLISGTAGNDDSPYVSTD